MKRARSKAKTRSNKLRSTPVQSEQTRALPFIEHVHELRRRLFYVALSVGLWAAVAYAFERHIVAALLRPARDQQFIYTSVGGGIDFLFRVCLYAGVAASIPVIVFQILRYIQPLLKDEASRFIAWGSVISGVFALAGVVYGYFWGLPSALHFLLHQFVTAQIRPLVTIQSYMSFVTVYMLGSALLFQVPLLLIFINRVKPLKPQKLFHYERWVVLLAFIGSGLMNPSPNIFAQLLLAGPIILMYQVGIFVVWFVNRQPAKRTATPEVSALLERDAEARNARARNFAARHAVAAPGNAARQMQPEPVVRVAAPAQLAPAQSVLKPQPAVAQTHRANQNAPVIRRRSYVDGFGARRYAYNTTLRPQQQSGD
ncbi:MAG TPA: twin-arginine translocase subunit TatC [Candidatus Saccharimonadales bacterium]